MTRTLSSVIAALFLGAILLAVSGVAEPIDLTVRSGCVWHGQARLNLANCTLDATEAKLTAPAGILPSETPLRQELVQIQSDRQTSLLMSFGVPDVIQLQVFQRVQGQWQLLVDLKPYANFDARPIDSPRLVMPVTLQAGANELYLSYFNHGDGRLQPELLTDRSWQHSSIKQHLFNGMLAGVMLTMLILIGLYRSATDNVSYIAYLLVVMAHVLMLPQIEGYYFQMLWPESPLLNGWMPIPLASMLLAAHAWFAWRFFSLPARYPLLTRWHRGVFYALAANLLVSLGQWFDGFPLLVAIAIVYGVLAVITARRAYLDQLPGAGLYLLGTCSLMVCSVLLMGLGVIGLNPFPFIDFFQYPKLGFLLETAFFSAALLSQIKQFRQQQAEERLRRLAEAGELAKAEQQKRAAQAKVADSSMRLAAVSHDISQPLASLRFAIEVLKAQQAQQPLAEHIDRTIQYAQTLLTDIMLDSKQSHQQQDLVELSGLLHGLVSDFLPSAQAKQLELRQVDTSLCIDTSYVVLRRIVQNLLANAIRYTPSGKVLVGVRRRPQALEIQVWDTGPGILPEQLTRLQQAFEQGEQQSAQQQGVGLGLFIVQSLCQQLGYQLKVQTQLRRGSCFSIVIPR